MPNVASLRSVRPLADSAAVRQPLAEPGFGGSRRHPSRACGHCDTAAGVAARAGRGGPSWPRIIPKVPGFWPVERSGRIRIYIRRRIAYSVPSMPESADPVIVVAGVIMAMSGMGMIAAGISVLARRRAPARVLAHRHRLDGCGSLPRGPAQAAHLVSLEDRPQVGDRAGVPGRGGLTMPCRPFTTLPGWRCWHMDGTGLRRGAATFESSLWSSILDRLLVG